MKTDAEFTKIRQETGSPLLVRVPFSLFGILMNFQFFLNGWKDPPSWLWVGFGATWIVMGPSWLIINAKITRARGLLFGLTHPILYDRWAWWLLVWPTQDEPDWRRVLAVGTLILASVFFVGGSLRWGLFPE